MYCSNCGEKINENAVVCVHCGCAVNSNKKMTNNARNGKGIASMVLGIIAILFALGAFANIGGLGDQIEYYDYTSSYVFGYLIGSVLVHSILAIIGLCLSISERKDNNNGFNTAGFWLNLAILILAALQFGGGFVYYFSYYFM